MDVKQAVSKAKEYVSDLFSDEGLANIRLEEVEYDESSSAWNITLGFMRPSLEPINKLMASVLAGLEKETGTRQYKVIRINDITARVVSVKNREPNQ